MGFFEVSLLRSDTDFLNRVAACYASETPLGEGVDPGLWSTEHSWDMASAPGFGDAYASAIAGGVERPGSDASVITDGQILSGVQAIMAAEAPPVEPPPVVTPQGGTDAQTV